MSATVEKQIDGSIATLLSTELNNLASSATAGAISSVLNGTGVFNNTVGGGGGDGYIKAKVELNLAAPAGTMTANTSANVWFIQNVDGTNYEYGDATHIPVRTPHVVFPVPAINTAYRETRECLIPSGNFFTLIQHNTGQTWNASGNTLKILPGTYEGIST